MQRYIGRTICSDEFRSREKKGYYRRYDGCEKK